VTGDSLKTCPVAVVALDEVELASWMKKSGI